MIGSLAQLASRPFLVGFLLPSLLALIVVGYLFQDLLPIAVSSAIFADDGKLDKLLYVVVLVWSAGLVLSMTINAQYQFLEGLRQPISRWDFAICRQRRLLEDLRQEALNLKSKNVSSDSKQMARLSELTIRLREEYPRNPERVLPTRFGNRIRAFEDYAGKVHGADAVTIWPALIAVVPKDYLMIIDNARANVDFFVNIVYLSSLIGGGILVRSIYLLLQPFDPRAPWMSGLSAAWYFEQMITACSLFVVCGLAYHFSLGVIPHWGRLVRVAFDAYLPALARQLGYELPLNLDDRRVFWSEVSQQLALHHPMQPQKWLRGSAPRTSSLKSTRDHK